MDGRQLRKFWLSGCLVAGAFGCNRNSVQQPLDQTSSALPVTGIPMATAPTKSLWSHPAKATLPIDVATEPARKGPAKAETVAAMADVQLAAAFDEKTIPSSREGLLDMARHGYQKALQQDPKSKAALLGMARYYSRVGEREKTVDQYKKYLGLYPKDRDVAHEVAMVHAQWKDWTGATAWCEYALKIDPENLSFRKTMAFCLARGGKWEEAFAVFCQIMPEAQARYLIGRMLEHQNQPEACRQQIQLALKADPNYADARDFLAELDEGYKFGGGPAAESNAIQRAGHTEEPK